jgi:hypothetical protein
MFRSTKAEWPYRIAIMAILLATPPLCGQTIDTIPMRAHTRFLASDLLEGRGTGTRGEHVAAAYIVSALMRIGAQPVDGKNFLQPIPLKRAIIDHAGTIATLNGVSYRSDRDFVWNMGGRRALRDFSGPLLYVGAGDSTALRHASETRGRVVVMTEALGSAASTYIPALIQAGAAGLVLLVPQQRNFELYVRSRGDARYFTDVDVNDPVWQADLPVIIAGPALSKAIIPAAPPAPFTTLVDTLRATFAAVLEEVRTANIAGVLRGSHAALASEYVVFTAHYDHLGISTPDARGDSIYNGFSDNAAGVAMLLAIGDVFRRQPAARSVLLLFFSGEERGLLGSTYFTAQPLITLGQMKAVINLDGGAPPAAPVDWRVAGGAASALGEVARRALATRGWTARLGGASPNSDYWPFLERGVPAIFIIPGDRWEGVSAEQHAALNARWNRYHRADDHYADDFPFIGLQRYAEVALMVGRAVANESGSVGR